MHFIQLLYASYLLKKIQCNLIHPHLITPTRLPTSPLPVETARLGLPQVVLRLKVEDEQGLSLFSRAPAWRKASYTGNHSRTAPRSGASGVGLANKIMRSIELKKSQHITLCKKTCASSGSEDRVVVGDFAIYACGSSDCAGCIPAEGLGGSRSVRKSFLIEKGGINCSRNHFIAQGGAHFLH